eukprot:TRINITY_DN331_c0_g1_i1.p1 TRINITY_DN331_c0_g1~~TRINITY_DN331_c0_g1_i1.p1  ORF type:complete len:452 (-),score=68.40 TRINITY_DN331_c0_g1_i1:884-2107(-)
MDRKSNAAARDHNSMEAPSQACSNQFTQTSQQDRGQGSRHKRPITSSTQEIDNYPQESYTQEDDSSSTAAISTFTQLVMQLSVLANLPDAFASGLNELLQEFAAMKAAQRQQEAVQIQQTANQERIIASIDGVRSQLAGLQASVNAQATTNSRLETQFLAKIPLIEAKIEQMNLSMTNRRPTGQVQAGMYTSRVQKMFCLELVVRNHAGFDSMFSTVFECGGVNWALKFDPPRPDRADWGFYLAVPNVGSLPISHAQCAEFSLKAVNLKDERLSREYRARFRFTPQQADWGWRRFISVAELSDPELGWVNSDGKVKVVARVMFVPSHLFVPAPVVLPASTVVAAAPGVRAPVEDPAHAAKRRHVDWEEVQTQRIATKLENNSPLFAVLDFSFNTTTAVCSQDDGVLL